MYSPKKMFHKSSFVKYLGKLSNKPLDILLSNRTVRKKIVSFIDKKIKEESFSNKNFPQRVQEDKYFIAKSMIQAMENALEGAKKAPHVRKAIVNFLMNSLFFKEESGYKKFLDKFGRKPPAFLVVSPGKFCNLKCTGCYASSSSASSENLDWEVFSKIVGEQAGLWGSHFTVISGGEPLLYKSKGKTLLDIAKDHSKNFFLMFTNGTLIDGKMAKKLAEIGNITPAISVEGFEKETDKRRGKGVYKKIVEAMKNLKNEGVPFGISITATNENADLVVSDEFVDYYFNKLGACYGWFFQLMPIGRADCLSLMVSPEQRVRMFRKTRSLVRDRGLFIADFWNSGCVSSGCISAGREGGYVHIEWNGNVTPCVFNPYSPANINDVYKKGGNLNDILDAPFFRAIRDWQDEYALKRKPKEMGNLIIPCAIKDHYDSMQKILQEYKPKPIDEAAEKALYDPLYQEGLKKYGNDVAKATDEIWKKEYLES